MKKKQLLALSALLTSWMGGCGGGGSGTPAAGVPPVPAQPAPGPSSWTNVKFGGGGYVPGLVFHPSSADVLIAADQNIAGRLYISGGGRGVLFNK